MTDFTIIVSSKKYGQTSQQNYGFEMCRGFAIAWPGSSSLQCRKLCLLV